MMRVLLSLSVLFLLAACSASRGAMEFRDATVSVVWPAPPEPTRIKYLAQIRGPQDIVAEPGKMERLFTLITGERATFYPFVTPMGIASDGKRFLYVADGAARLVHCLDFEQQVVHYLQAAGDTPLRSPGSVAVAPDGKVYITDSVLAKVFIFSPENAYLGELQGRDLLRPAGVAVTRDGEKIVIDVLAHRLLVFDKNDRFVREFPKNLETAGLNRPTHVVVDRNKNVYVTDAMNFRVVVYDWQGNELRAIGEPGDTPGYLSRPKGVAVDSEGHLYVVDSLQGSMQIFDMSGQLLLAAGNNGKRVGEFNLPSGIHIDSMDRIYVSDTYNRRVQVFQYVKGPIQ